MTSSWFFLSTLIYTDVWSDRAFFVAVGCCLEFLATAQLGSYDIPPRFLRHPRGTCSTRLCNALPVPNITLHICHIDVSFCSWRSSPLYPTRQAEPERSDKQWLHERASVIPRIVNDLHRFSDIIYFISFRLIYDYFFLSSSIFGLVYFLCSLNSLHCFPFAVGVWDCCWS